MCAILGLRLREIRPRLLLNKSATRNMIKHRYFIEIKKDVDVISFSACDINSKSISFKIYFEIWYYRIFYFIISP